MTGRALHRAGLAAVATTLLLLVGAGAAHGFVVIGELRSSPNPPRPGEPATLIIAMQDQSSAPVEDAVVTAEITPPGGGAATSLAFEEREPGLYVSSFAPSVPGAYSVLVRDLTFPEEVVQQTVELPVGGEPFVPAPFLLPVGSSTPSPQVWLVWLIGVPLLAGAVVTLLVFRYGGEDAEAAGE